MRSPRSTVVAVLLVAVALVAGANTHPSARAQERHGAADRARAVTLAFYRVFNDGRLDRLDTILAEDWRDVPLADGQEPGRAGFKPVVTYFRTVFPDLTATPEAVHVSENGTIVTVRARFSGTHRAEFLGIPPTGARVSFRTADVHRIHNGRIVETWHLEDLYGAQLQLQAAQ